MTSSRRRVLPCTHVTVDAFKNPKFSSTLIIHNFCSNDQNFEFLKFLEREKPSQIECCTQLLDIKRFLKNKFEHAVAVNIAHQSPQFRQRVFHLITNSSRTSILNELSNKIIAKTDNNQCSSLFLLLNNIEYDRQYDFRIAAKSIQSNNAIYGQEAVFRISTSTSKSSLSLFHSLSLIVN